MVVNRKILLAVVAIIILLIMYLVNRIGDLSFDSQSWKSSYESEHASAKFWRNKDGLSQAEIKNKEVGISVLRQQHDKEILELQKNIAGLKKNLKNLQSVTTVSTEISGEIKVPIRTDTINNIIDPGRSFTYSDKWATINGYFLRDSASISYKVRDSINVVQYWKSPLFRRSVLYTDVISANPNSELQTLKSTTIATPRKNFVVGPFGGISTAGPILGIGVTYKLFEF